jgi:ATP-dependent Clp protease, protease subunit
VNYFEYTLNPDALEPIMLLYGQIGTTEDENGVKTFGIDGNQFTRELMFLDTLNKPRIQIWINSPGGVVTDGEQICYAMQKCKTPIDTYNTGTCASIAGPIFLFGNKRCMMDWSKLMMHNPFGGDDKALEAFKNTIVTMISNKSRGKLTAEKVSELMSQTTWMGANDCHEMGLCDEVESSEEYSSIKNVAPSLGFKEYKTIVNKIFDKKPNMNKVANLLKLNPALANIEDAITEEITKLQNKFIDSENKVGDLEAKIADKQKELDKLTAEYKTMKDAVDTANRVTAENAAKTEIEASVKVGKIENKVEVIKAWTDKYVSDPAGTKTLLDSIPAKVKGADFEVVKDLGAPKTFNAADVMNKVKENLKK